MDGLPLDTSAPELPGASRGQASSGPAAPLSERSGGRSAVVGRVRSLSISTSRITRLSDWLRGSPSGMVSLALIVGFGAGLGAVVFRELIALFTLVFTGTRDYAATPGAANPAVPGLGPWFLLAVPVLGGLLYGPLIDRFAREARGHGVPEVMFAVTEQGGRIRPRVAVVKSIASALCLGAGGSVGREGPIVQIGSALGSSLGQRLRLTEANLRLLVACGAAGGISATFNAPIAGVFFALELILRDFEARSFGVVVLASVMADIVGQSAFGSAAFLNLPAFQVNSVWEYPIYAALGLPAALVGVAFIRTLYGTEDVADRLWRGRPEWLRPAVGGVALGLLLLALPQLYGVGYPPIDNAEAGSYVTGFLLLLVVGKLAATSITIAIGGSGGVFAPSLYMGAMLGVAYGGLANQIAPGMASPVGAYGLVGMGAVFAAAAHAPITSVIIMFELTGDYRIILPMMLAVSLSTGISTLLSADTIYTLKLRRRGIDVERRQRSNPMSRIPVGEAMDAVPRPVVESSSLGDILDRLMMDDREALPVVDDTGRYRGVLTVAEAEASIRDDTFDVTAGSLAQPLPALHPADTLEHALTLLVNHEHSGLPVLAEDGARVVGWITHRDVMRAYVSTLGAAPGAAQPLDLSARGEKQPRPGTAVSRATSLFGYRVVEMTLEGPDPPAGLRVDCVDWPPPSLPIHVRRDGESFRPKPSTVLHEGDVLTLLVPAALANRYRKALAARLNGDGESSGGKVSSGGKTGPGGKSSPGGKTSPGGKAAAGRQEGSGGSSDTGRRRAARG
jgi:CIC family chloride channel protein